MIETLLFGWTPAALALRGGIGLVCAGICHHREKKHLELDNAKESILYHLRYNNRCLYIWGKTTQALWDVCNSISDYKIFGQALQELQEEGKIARVYDATTFTSGWEVC